MSNKTDLRRGHTTGACAAAAAKAALTALLTGQFPAYVTIDTPDGVWLTLEVEDTRAVPGSARCAVRKDAGDDPDVTDGLLVYANVSLTESDEIEIDGGEGVGRVTRPGLDQPVGAAAINRVPRGMIEREMRALLRARGARVEIEIPGGELVAAKTYNPRLGIVGGLSVLGTSGLVEPMSRQALVDSIHTELDMLRAESDAPVLLTPGGYGERFAAEQLRLPLIRAVQCSNFLGEALQYAQALGFRGALLVAHAGKLVKVAGGIFQTHSSMADARMEIITAHAALAGITPADAAELLRCVSTDAAFGLLAQKGILTPVCGSLLLRIDQQLRQKTPGFAVGAVLFTNELGFLGQTELADSLREDLIRGMEQA